MYLYPSQTLLVENITAYDIDKNAYNLDPESFNFTSQAGALLYFTEILSSIVTPSYTVKDLTAYSLYSYKGTVINIETQNLLSPAATELSLTSLSINNVTSYTNGVFRLNANYNVVISSSSFTYNKAKTGPKDIYVKSLSGLNVTSTSITGDADVDSNLESVYFDKIATSTPSFEDVTFQCNPSPLQSTDRFKEILQQELINSFALAPIQVIIVN